MRTSECPKWNEVVKRNSSRRDWSPRMETSSARFCSAHNGQLVSQAKGGSSKQQLMYLSANKRSWFSTGTFVRNPFSPTFWFPTCKIAGTQNCRACAGTQAPPQLCYFRWSHITGFGQWTVSERTCHFHAEKG